MTAGREATRANVVRNARAERDRLARWTPTRDACWAFLQPLIQAGASVAIVGAGKGHTVPLRRIHQRAGSLTLIDIDPVSARMARRRLGHWHGRRVTVIKHDVTGGLADQIVAAAHTATRIDVPSTTTTVLPGAPYDVVIGDLLYTQLVFPGLLDGGLDPDLIRTMLNHAGQSLVDLAVAQIHTSVAAEGIAVHLHDPIAWLPGRPQPVTLQSILSAASTSRALQRLHSGSLVGSGDVRAAVMGDPDVQIIHEACWHWPFAWDTDYLVWAIAAKPRP